MNTILQTRYAPLPLFLAAAVFILFAPVFWMGVEAPGNDRTMHLAENTALFQQVAPVMHYGFSRMGRLDVPLWNNRQWCGTPFFANPTHGLLQPLNVVFFFFETPRAMALHAFIALSLMGFFFVLFMRSMQVRHIPAVLGGVVYVCSCATAAVMSRPAYINVLVWLPLMCCILREYAGRPQPWLRVAGGLVTAFILLSGSPLMAFAGILTAYAYGLSASVMGLPVRESQEEQKAGSLWTRLGGLILMLALGVLLSAVQWLPTLFWLRTLDAPLDFLKTFAVAGEAPRSLRGLFAQFLEGHALRLPALAYYGVCAALLLPAALFHPIPRWERGFLVLLVSGLLVLAFSELQAAASEGAFLVLAYPASFAVAVLAALGADRLFAARRDSLTPRLWGPLLLCSAVFLLLFLVAPDPVRGRMVPFAFSVAVFALFRTRWAGIISGVVLLVFLFIDLSASTVIHQAHPFFLQQGAPAIDARLAALVRETALGDRLMVSAYPNHPRIHPNIGMSDGFAMASGIGQPLSYEQRCWWEALTKDAEDTSAPDASISDRPHRLMEAVPGSAHLPLLNVMGVRALAIAEGGALGEGRMAGMHLRRRGNHDDVQVYANEDALNRIRWASQWHLSLDIHAAITAMSAPDFDGKGECIVVPVDAAISHLVNVMPDQKPAAGGMNPEADRTVSLNVLEDQPERLVIAVKNPESGLLVVSDTYDSDWRARVNGQPAPILRANGLFRGIALPAGEHRVEFYYQPLALYAGIFLSGVTTLMLFLWGLRSIAKVFGSQAL